MYFKFFKLQDWGKRSGEGRRRNCAVLPKDSSTMHVLSADGKERRRNESGIVHLDRKF